MHNNGLARLWDGITHVVTDYESSEPPIPYGITCCRSLLSGTRPVSNPGGTPLLGCSPAFSAPREEASQTGTKLEMVKAGGSGKPNQNDDTEPDQGILLSGSAYGREGSPEKKQRNR